MIIIAILMTSFGGEKEKWQTDNKPLGNVHLVGSVPLESSQAVFSLASSILGNHLCRVPDGETGERINWISWQIDQFAKISSTRAYLFTP